MSTEKGELVGITEKELRVRVNTAAEGRFAIALAAQRALVKELGLPYTLTEAEFDRRLKEIRAKLGVTE